MRKKVEHAGLSNVFIESVLRKTCTDFFGVFSADSIPDRLTKQKRASVVCNLSREKEDGTHFVTLLLTEKKILYLDSFGLACYVPEILKFLHQSKREIVFFTEKIQDDESVFCGFYAILFCLYFDAGIWKKPKLNFSKDDLFENDRKCISYILEMLQ